MYISCQGFQILCLYLLKKNKIDCRPVSIFGEDSVVSCPTLSKKYRAFFEPSGGIIPGVPRWTTERMETACGNTTEPTAAETPVQKEQRERVEALERARETPEEWNASRLTSGRKQKMHSGFNHAIVEFKCNDKWLLLDPTFNCMYKHNNKLISADEYQICMDKKENIDFHYEFGTPKKQRIEYYPIPLKFHNKIYYPGCKINKIQKINNSSHDREENYRTGVYKQFLNN